MKKQMKWMSVVSAAMFLSAAAPVFAAPALAQNSGWVEEDGGFRFYDSDGYYLTDSWKKQSGDWFYLDENGFVTFERQIDEYYVGKDGKRVNSTWISIPNEEDWDSSDAPENYWYYFGKNGKYVSSKFQEIDDNWYYFDGDGHMETGLAEVEGSVYYFDETSGIRQTGWVSLEDTSEDAEEEYAWHYFDKNGKMVVNQIDRKIDDSYYTFVNGKMQKGWFKLPETDDSTATDSNASKEEVSVDGYRYYDPETGKRVSGWLTMEGAPGISEEGEEFTFYFKNGAPLHASTGIQTFTITPNKYGFNTKGELQTGLQVVTLENGEIANFYFGTDGIMKTGKQMIYNEEADMDETWFFHTEGSKRGQGFHGILDNKIYEYGRRLDGYADLRYSPVTFQGNQYLVNASGSIQKATSGSKSETRPELGAGYKDFQDNNDTVWVVDKNGIIQE
ncbi:MAG: cell wall-binding protein [Hungatella sp.]